MRKAPHSAPLPISAVLERLLSAKRLEIDRECARFVCVGDPESLHDLRVAMRRLDSLFSGFVSCFLPENTQAKTLHLLFKETNHARDLEVTLALLEKHQLVLPWLQQQWQTDLTAEYRRLRKTLPAAWWPLSRQFDTPDALLAENMPAKTLEGYAGKQTAKLKKRLLKQTRRVCKQWDNKRAHKLRIRGKHIRYLLEPFAEAQQCVASAVSRMKRFQDQFGDYHDLVVMRKRLLQLEQKATLHQYQVLHQATCRLKQEQQQLRRALRHDYRGKAYRKLCRALTAAPKELARN